MRRFIIGVDFDGTVVDHRYPEIGANVPDAVDFLKLLADAGADIILWTMRSDLFLDDATAWFEREGIPLFGVNRNPEQHTWSNSQKAYCNVYVDDAALGVPLLINVPGFARPCVDWSWCGPQLARMLAGHKKRYT